MKIGKLVMVALVALGFSACSNNDTNFDVGKPSELKVSFDVPKRVTRGVLNEPLTDLIPQLDVVTIYVMRGDQVVDFKSVSSDELENGTNTVTFEAIVLGGKEEVVISANVKDENSTNVSSNKLVDRSVKEIQPGFMKSNMGNIYYFGSSPISLKAEEGEDGHKLHEVSVELQPLAARVEVGGHVKFNTETVKNLTVEVITPDEYIDVYGSKVYYHPSVDDKGPLWLDLDKASSSGHGYDLIRMRDAEGGLKNVVANHLFSGTRQKISFRINADLYVIDHNEDKTPRHIKETALLKDFDNEELEVDSYVYIAGAADTGEEVAGIKESIGKDAFQLWRIDRNKEGQLLLLGEAFDGERKVNNTIDDLGLGFFSLVNFSKEVGGKLNPIDKGQYEGGKIYKIDLSEIDWNNDGKFDPEEDLYDPIPNGPGTDNPTESADLIVKATVKAWIIENVVPGIE